VENALKNSAYTCLDKPLDMEEVFKIIEEILERKRSQR
jgi:DNA-binding NtrC family response regulator